jgi:sortase A
MKWLSKNAWARQALSGLSVLLAVIGVGMLAYPFATNLYQNRLQDGLEGDFAGLDAKKWKKGLGEGDALTRIRIPATGVDVIVVEGTSASALRAGAGHYPATPLPGEEGNVAIAGHRTTYGRPFQNNDQLRTGDKILLETPVGKFTYAITRDPFAVTADDWLPIANTPDQRTLTLTTCHPPGSASERLIVKAKLVKARVA